MAQVNEPKPDPAALQKRAVAGSFIFKSPDDGGSPLVALFRRSDKVRTYPQKLGSISGSIETNDSSPLTAAWRELHEETTLDSSSLELLRTGKPYSFGDASVGREWSIHPFAFRLKTVEEGGRGEEGITIDWEHEGWEWHNPRDVVDIDAFGGVPRIAESLRRVWFEKDLGEKAGGILARGLHRLKTDHQSGARQMATAALEIFRDVVNAMEGYESKEQFWANVRFAAWHICKNGRESMGAAILSVLLKALKDVELMLKQNRDWTTNKCEEHAARVLESSVSARAEDSGMAVARAFASYAQAHFPGYQMSGRPLRILTLSESSTITKGLLYLVQTGVQLDVSILESRPLFEGVSLAERLVSDTQSPKSQVTIYTDAAVALAADSVDIVLIGADRIAASGAVSNKTGSLPAILSAKHISPNAKTVVLSDLEKIAPPGDTNAHVIEENSPAQVSRSWEDGRNSERVRNAAASLSGGSDGGTGRTKGGSKADVQVRNVFFEWVDPQLVDAYVTEQGVWSVEDIKKHSEALGREEDRLFGDL